MFHHSEELQYEVRVGEPDPECAKLLQQAIAVARPDVCPGRRRRQCATASITGAVAIDALGSDRLETDPPPSDAMVVVGGIRANQYADGHGGLGYYEALGEELTTSEDGSDRAAESLVGRLRYTDVNADAARTERVASFGRLFVVHT